MWFKFILGEKCYGCVLMVLYILLFDVKVVKFGLCWVIVKYVIGIISIIIFIIK